MKNSLSTHLFISHEFIAAHSLSVREEKHDHRWKVRIEISGIPKAGMIINLPSMKEATHQVIAKLEHTYLNENLFLFETARKFPTCESLSEDLFLKMEEKVLSHFSEENPSLKLVSVRFTLFEMDGQEVGEAEVRRA